MTFRHAVAVLRTLSIRYLWIDSLCIIQNSTPDWTAEAANMAEVYSNALFTLSASDAHSSNEGLFRDTPPPPQVTYMNTGDHGGTPTTIGVRSGLPLFRHETRDFPLVNRGWIFQERSLSPAVLHFCRRQIYWECQQGVMSQAIPFYQSGESSLLQQFASIVDRPLQEPPALNYFRWRDVVEAYSIREFTKPEDRAAAFLGIRAKIKEISGWDVHAGLCKQWLHVDLVWTFYSPMKPVIQESGSAQRLPYPVAQDGITDETVTLTPAAARRSRYPTWSWVSVDYPITYHWAQDCRAPFDLNVRAERFGGVERSASVEDADYHPPELLLYLRGTIVRSSAVLPGRDDWRLDEIRFTQDDHDLHLSGTMDPGCSIPTEPYILPLCCREESSKSLDNVHFLVPQRTDITVKDKAQVSSNLLPLCFPHARLLLTLCTRPLLTPLCSLAAAAAPPYSLKLLCD